MSFLSLLLDKTTPDNIPDGYGGLDKAAGYDFAICVIGILLLVIVVLVAVLLYRRETARISKEECSKQASKNDIESTPKAPREIDNNIEALSTSKDIDNTIN